MCFTSFGLLFLDNTPISLVHSCNRVLRGRGFLIGDIVTIGEMSSFRILDGRAFRQVLASVLPPPLYFDLTPTAVRNVASRDIGSYLLAHKIPPPHDISI